MALFEFFRRVGRIELRWMLLLAAVAGLANALLIVTVNEVAGLAARGNRPDWSHVLIFVGIFVAYYQFDKIAILRATIATERLLKDLRSSVVDKLRCSELQ